MSSLQIGLMLIGALVIVGVFAYNQWTTRRSAPRRSAVKGTGASDGVAPLDPSEGLLEAVGQRREPVLGDALAAQAQPDAGDATADTSGDVGAAEAPPAAVAGILPAKAAQLDPLIDAVAALNLEHQVSGDAVLAALPGTRRVGSKPFLVEGLNAVTQDWELPRVGQRYTALQAGIQLANRMGALNEIEFSEFVVKVQAFADAVSAAPDFPEMMQEVARGRELDQFASAHDAQLGFTVRARRAAWSPGYLAQHAAQQGFVAGALPGRMVLPSSHPGGAPVLVLQFETQAALAEDPEQSALREFHLTLDVPHVPRSESPFVRLRECATALAKAMEGVVTDDSGQPLHPETMDRIGADLETLYNTLDSRELAAGSALARRLFS
ncbi:cell division protein ZipA C-terminal FtsZ-binding domain-containing protein [Hydrogenophaga aquatica]